MLLFNEIVNGIKKQTDSKWCEFFAKDQLERAIGVIYRPETERQSHYFKAKLSLQFDAVIHFDETNALLPLDKNAHFTDSETVCDLFPFGI